MSLFNTLKTLLHIGATDAATVAAQAPAITSALEASSTVAQVVAEVDAYAKPAEESFGDIKALIADFAERKSLQQDVADIEKLVNDALAIVGVKQVAAAQDAEQGGAGEPVGAQKADVVAS